MADMFESRHAPLESMACHRHATAFAALVIEGDYVESSPDGRYLCAAGTITIHPAWHAHADWFGARGAAVLNLPVAFADGLVTVRTADISSLLKLARRDPRCAAAAAFEEAEPNQPLAPAPWLARLVRLLGDDSRTPINELAHRCGVSPAHASRACKRWFGVGPAALRREGRLRRAIGMLNDGASPSEAAAAAGFSDQPHMTRLLKRATGHTPRTFSRR